MLSFISDRLLDHLLEPNGQRFRVNEDNEDDDGNDSSGTSWNEDDDAGAYSSDGD